MRNPTLSLFFRYLVILFFLLPGTGCFVKEEASEPGPRHACPPRWGGQARARERGEGKLYFAAPTLLPGTERWMKTPGFWLSRHPFPDKLILSPNELKDLNLDIEDELKLRRDITGVALRFSGEEIGSGLEDTLNRFQGRRLYLANGKKANPAFYQEIKENLNLNGIPPEIKTRFGFVVRYADQRILPAKNGLFAKRKDIDFDELQNSALDIGTPLAVLHKSLDGKWYYAIGPLSLGWVEAEKVVLCRLKQLKNFLKHSSFAVVIKAKGDIFLNPSLTDYYDYVRMGARFPLCGKGDAEIAQVAIPFRDKDGTFSQKTAYIRKEDVHQGYLPYTARNVIRQAFELLNAPYGWGGMYGEQDCSRFIQEIFATVGIALPRNSSQQARVGFLLKEFDVESAEREKIDVLAGRGIGGITVLYLRGHIMLFLGMVENRPYAIHSIWAYRQKAGRGNIIRVVNRVAVTNLALGKGSKKGSLLERLRMVRIIASEEPEGK